MKMVIDTDKMFKLSVNPDGQLQINLANGKTLQGALTPEEQEVIAVAVTRVSESLITFEPKPTDYLAMHLSDVATLELQAIVIAELREKAKTEEASAQEYADSRNQLTKELADANNELEKVKPQLRDANLTIQEQAKLLAQLRAELTAYGKADPLVQTSPEELQTAPAEDGPPKEGVTLPADGTARKTELRGIEKPEEPAIDVRQS